MMAFYRRSPLEGTRAAKLEANVFNSFGGL
jgi:hypothetical protein